MPLPRYAQAEEGMMDDYGNYGINVQDRCKMILSYISYII